MQNKLKQVNNWIYNALTKFDYRGAFQLSYRKCRQPYAAKFKGDNIDTDKQRDQSDI